MEQARIDLDGWNPSDIGDEPGWSNDETVVAFPRGFSPSASQSPAEPSRPKNERDFLHALDVVRDAAAAIRAADQRALQAELRMNELVERATTELRAAELRIQAADARTRAAESQASALEERLRETESWLARICQVIATELPGCAED